MDADGNAAADSETDRREAIRRLDSCAFLLGGEDVRREARDVRRAKTLGDKKLDGRRLDD